MTRHVVCPVALHPDGAPLRIPIFEHPKAGLQLIKGSFQDGERFEAGAARELFERSGVETRSAIYLGPSDAIQTDAVWHFSLCRVSIPVREAWQHFCKDGGGHLFKFTWLDLSNSDHDLPTPYSNAISWIKDTL
ncbi:NUDIX domain-containing protein [Planktotalea sp.]|uniref:NUDIX domain-containing protein n=1 Tax=Planktotalea sp. TaxID=2029877 RepID=UPI0025E5CBE6|nr:NUDIX domain-containing protein [Planktotalea sp.]